ncbi:apolipoprotein N-acyltransferase [Rhodobacterales bacterium LSUCC0031]|nr:apolipoprotein N-acyltransferase [Rhodobacterales bacterium LSUCC0031]
MNTSMTAAVPDGGASPIWPKILAALAGMAAAIGHAPFDLWIIALIAFAMLLHLGAAARSPRLGAGLFWLGGTSYFAVALNWLVEPFLVDAATTGWMAPFALAAMAGGLALFWWLAAYLALRLLPQASKGARIAGLVGLLLLAETARAVVFTGFPWAHPGHVLIGGPLLPLAGVAGAHGLTLVVLAIAGGMAYFGTARPLAAMAVLSVLLVVAIRLDATVLPPPPPTPDAPVIRLVQPNAPQHLKWRADMIPVFFQRGLSLTAQASARLPDLVIWPETSLPVLLDNSASERARIAAAARGAMTLIGAQRFAGFLPRNSLALLDRNGEILSVYDKHRLVPFGEYMPGGMVAEALGLRGLAERLDGGYRPGPGPELIALGDSLGQAFAMVCYEAIFARDLARTPRGDWMVQVTNDAWFGRFSGPYQHLALARLRAAEQGLPLLRAANTGVSAVIDARGGIVAMLPLNTAGALDAPLPVAMPPTLYAKTGDAPIILIVLLATAGLLVHARRRQALRPGP